MISFTSIWSFRIASFPLARESCSSSWRIPGEFRRLTGTWKSGDSLPEIVVRLSTPYRHHSESPQREESGTVSFGGYWRERLKRRWEGWLCQASERHLKDMGIMSNGRGRSFKVTKSTSERCRNRQLQQRNMGQWSKDIQLKHRICYKYKSTCLSGYILSLLPLAWGQTLTL